MATGTQNCKDQCEDTAVSTISARSWMVQGLQSVVKVIVLYLYSALFVVPHTKGAQA